MCVAACERVLTEAGIKIQLHPNGTAIEGEWVPVFAAIESCHQAVQAMGCPRVYTNLKVTTRTNKEQTLEDKAASGSPGTEPLKTYCGSAFSG
ncbi:MTH1187 family thiamine-binding protein [Cyanobium sp. HWJ4-Hawea]|uniref:MTH1187 family thiamine-binding protein n=1 Tax=Cyanobium sp. HWJ4-Hawea TaxID=2823713 RepID=UPI0020CEF8E9|nr:MTH1187 family thiamine-binding protein [Cyanobium sp. HWJ4-Hawea]MCP9809248.1 MTH1187 family thiamine-binding protein [Cyanobium sp. HWJ4-Hawea]